MATHTRGGKRTGTKHIQAIDHRLLARNLKALRGGAGRTACRGAVRSPGGSGKEILLQIILGHRGIEARRGLCRIDG